MDFSEHILICAKSQFCTLKLHNSGHFGKVHIFSEGHKILRNLHLRFVLCSNGQIYSGNFAKFCSLLSKKWTLIWLHTCNLHWSHSAEILSKRAFTSRDIYEIFGILQSTIQWTRTQAKIYMKAQEVFWEK